MPSLPQAEGSQGSQSFPIGMLQAPTTSVGFLPRCQMSPASSLKGCSVLTSLVGHMATEHPNSHRNKDTTRDEFIFYSKRLMRLLIEHALSFLPLKVGP